MQYSVGRRVVKKLELASRKDLKVTFQAVKASNNSLNCDAKGSFPTKPDSVFMMPNRN